MKAAKISVAGSIGIAIAWAVLGIWITLTQSLYFGIGCVLLGIAFAIYAIVKRRKAREQEDRIEDGGDETRI